MIEKVEVMASRLELMENRLQRESGLANSDSSKCYLFISTCRYLPDLKTSFEDYHLYSELKCKVKADFDQGKHTERLDEVYDLYYSIMILCSVVTSPVMPPKALHLISRVMLPSIKFFHFTGIPAAWVNFSNIFETFIIHKDLSNGECFMYLMLAFDR
ncbi:hypothetical protein PR048_026836 [Dryococelus australis]|uniref:Uncharacterized protein n=1 Tax=Dryococelus australis TaxID=614101 RepID=A0ABQ9GMF8_9NEOP|nr:hypothetical protein PR048_026836 [Dryococelus australis]